MIYRSAVYAAGQKDHIRPEPSYIGYLLVRKPSVVGGYDIHNDGPGTECSPLGAFTRHGFYNSCNCHLQTASGRGS